VSVLFGSILGLSGGRAALTAAVALGVSAVLVAIARPLLFASIDEDVAVARGVPVRLLGFGFLALVGITAAESTQVVGALLILGLLAAPAGAALRITARPLAGLGLSAGIAVASLWAGLTASYYVPKLPPSFGVLAVATATYLLAILATSPRRGHRATVVGAT
jgi:zinc/manganese transport system permease protein